MLMARPTLISISSRREVFILKFIDLHCDTLMRSYLLDPSDIYQMPGMLDIERMKQAGQLAQFFTIFMPAINDLSSYEKDGFYDDEDYIDACLNNFYHSMDKHSDIIAPAYNGADFRVNLRQGKMSGF